MYRQFIKNMDCFLALNKMDEGDKNYRLELVKELEPLKKLELFNALKQNDSKHYQKLSAIIWAVSENSDRYPSFKVLSWELWGYGFDGAYYEVDSAELEEQLKIIDLLLSTQYWH